LSGAYQGEGANLLFPLLLLIGPSNLNTKIFVYIREITNIFRGRPWGGDKLISLECLGSEEIFNVFVETKNISDPAKFFLAINNQTRVRIKICDDQIDSRRLGCEGRVVCFPFRHIESLIFFLSFPL